MGLRLRCHDAVDPDANVYLRKIVVREVNGSPVYLQDVALVEDGFEDVRRRSRVDGQPAQGLAIRKQRGANAVAVRAAAGPSPGQLWPGSATEVSWFALS